MEKLPNTRELGTATTIGELKKLIADYPDDMSFGFRNKPMQTLLHISYEDGQFICFDDLITKPLIDRSILMEAIQKFGVEVQINKIQEEALELALVLNQRNCPTKNSAEMNHKLYDELADMKIMMEYAEIIFDIKRIQSRVIFKINRLIEKHLNNK